MGINLYVEDEQGTRLADLLDPKGYVGCIVSLGGHGNTSCLRFIDPYGDTVFNQLQVPILIRELEATRDLVTPARVAELGQQFLEGARNAKWAPTVIESIVSSNRSVSASDIRAHLERLLDLARRAQEEGVHAYLKFYGD